IAVELSAPAYAFLISFNCDGTEQLLWPVGKDQKPNRQIPPPRQQAFRYPARAGKWISFDDTPKGGLQAFVVVAARARRAGYGEWRERWGELPWRKLPAGTGVWSSDGEGVYPVVAGKVLRVREVDPAGAPPLALPGLCRTLRQGGEVVEALAFPIRPGEGK